MDPSSYGGSRMTSYTAMGKKMINANNEVEEEIPVKGIPEGAGINYSSWSPDGKKVAFCLTPAGDERVPLELWVVDMETMEAKQVLSGYKMNTIFETYAWIDDDTIVAAVIPPDHPPPPAKPAAPLSPVIQMNTGKNWYLKTHT